MYEYEDAWIMTAELNEKKDGCKLWMRPLVLCKDCIYRDARDGMCEHVQQVRDPDWYCADGERR